jgi:hypothetical protein
VLWLTVVVAMAFGWMVHIQSMQDQLQALRYKSPEQSLQEARSLVNQHAIAPAWYDMLVTLTACAAAVMTWAAIYHESMRRQRISVMSLVVLTAFVATALGLVRLGW